MQLSDGSYVDTQGQAVNMKALGVDLTAPIHLQVTQHLQEELFEPLQPQASQLTQPSSTLPSLPPTLMLTAVQSQSTVISVPSVQSVLSSVRASGERRLVSQEAKSDLFEDHLLPMLDSGVMDDMISKSDNNNILYFRNN